MDTDNEDLDVKIEATRAEIDKLVQRFAELKNERDQLDELGTIDVPYVTGWGLAYEFTSTELEIKERAGRGIIVKDGQALSFSSGLGSYLRSAFK